MNDSDRARLPALTSTTRELYLYSGNQCAYRGCSEVLLMEDGTWNCNVAHIYGVKSTAARGAHSLTNEELRHPSNLLLVCRKHHEVIDNRDNESDHTAEQVQAMKNEHEQRFRTALVSLGRIVDSTSTAVLQRPTNLCALDGFCWDGMTDVEKDENVDFAEPFIQALATQPEPLRDVIALVLNHGRPDGRFGGSQSTPVTAPVSRIEGAAQIHPEDLRQRAKSLANDGLLAIEEDEGAWFFVLIDPTAKSVGWDLFVAIHELAAGDRTVIKSTVLDLNFSLLDK